MGDLGKDTAYSLSHDLLQQAQHHVRFSYQAACMAERLVLARRAREEADACNYTGGE